MESLHGSAGSMRTALDIDHIVPAGSLRPSAPLIVSLPAFAQGKVLLDVKTKLFGKLYSSLAKVALDLRLMNLGLLGVVECRARYVLWLKHNCGDADQARTASCCSTSTPPEIRIDRSCLQYFHPVGSLDLLYPLCSRGIRMRLRRMN